MMPDPVSPPQVVYRRPNPVDLLAGLLLCATVVLHVVAMFPTYFSIEHQSLASQTDQAVLYGVLAAAWAFVLAVGLTGPSRLPVAAALAVGMAATELGFRLSDLGQIFRYGSDQAGDGLWLMTVAWGLGALGALAAVAAAVHQHRSTDTPGTPVAGELAMGTPQGWALGVTLLAVAVAGAFLPPWDHYHVTSSVTGNSLTRNLGNAFSNPWQVTLGNVLAAGALLVVPLVAVRLKNRYLGAAAVCGGLLVLASQLVSAVVQVDQSVDPLQLGITPTQMSQLGLSISLRLSGWFVLEALAAFALFAAVMVWATLRVHENSPGTLPSAPESRSDAIPWLS